MTDQTSTFNQTLTALLEQYNEHTDSDLTAFLREQMWASQAYADDKEVDTALRDILSTIDSISQGFQEIQDYRRKGRSVAVWMRDKLEEITAAMSGEDKKAVILAAKKGLATGNQELAGDLTSGEISGPLLPDLPAEDFSGLHRTAIAENLRQELEANVVLETMGLNLPAGGKPFSPGPIVSVPKIPVVVRYFEDALNTESDDRLKKVVSAGAEIARKMGLLPEEMNARSSEEIAVTVDRGMSQIKLAYQAGMGRIQPETVINQMVDRTAAEAKTMISIACVKAGAKIGEKAGEAIGSTLGRIFGPQGAAAGKAVGSWVGRLAGEKAGEVIGKGVEKVAIAAKKVGAALCDAVRDGCNTVKEGIKNALSGLKSFFSW